MASKVTEQTDELWRDRDRANKLRAAAQAYRDAIYAEGMLRAMDRNRIVEGMNLTDRLAFVDGVYESLPEKARKW